LFFGAPAGPPCLLVVGEDGLGRIFVSEEDGLRRIFVSEEEKASCCGTVPGPGAYPGHSGYLAVFLLLAPA
jgi:hypothetical protein